jgi:serine/threonine protein kinase
MTISSLVSTAESVDALHSTPAPAPHRVKPWELVELAAEGTLTQIYRARPAGSPADRPAAYAVKMLRPAWRDDARAAGLLRREATVGRSVSHPHLVAVLSASMSAAPQYLVMPWLSGKTLAARLQSQGRIDLSAALWIGRQVAEALAALEAAGWMHGDVKPSNVFLSSEGHVTLLDLGFARRIDRPDSLGERFVTGTCNYMAPELLGDTPMADVRSDLYSLGVVLFEMLSGRRPFEASDSAELAGQHRGASVPRIESLVDGLPPEAASLVYQLLAKTPDDRLQTAEAAVARLTALEIGALASRFRP